MLTHGELFAGISGFGLGFERAGIAIRWAVEIDASCRRVLTHHHPEAAIHEDVREVGAHNLAPVDIITFGSPCQDLSVAGKRKGFDGARSGLYFEAIRVIAELRPAVAVWENVPGALSSNGGRDFAAALDALAELGALDIAWRILDAQYFGVAQRRRRVFVVADFGGERAAEILALADGLRRDSPPRREAGEEIAGTPGAGSPVGGPGHDLDRTTYITEPATYWDGGQLADTLDASNASKQQMMPEKRRFQAVITHALTGEGHDASEDGTGRGTPLVAFQQNQRDEVRDLGDLAGALPAQPGMKQQNYIANTTMAVRRLTPRECSRLQGFDDDWLDLDPPLSDSTKYRMLGNAVAVPVAAWLGRNLVAAWEEGAGE